MLRLSEALIHGARSYIDTALNGFHKRIADIEAREPEKGARGEPGPEGIGLADVIRDADGNLVAVLSDGRTKLIGNISVKDGVDGRDGATGAKGEPGDRGDRGADGRDGLDGKDGEPGLPGERGADGKDGVDGKDGKDGLDGQPGRDGIDGKDGERGLDGRDGKDADPDMVRQIIIDEVAKIPPPRDGTDGRDGLDGKDGERGLDGKDGPAGRDGIGVASAAINRAGELLLTTSDGRTHELGPVLGADGAAGKDGAPGKDGVDGLGFDDLEVVHDGARGFTFRFARGDVVKEFPFTIPVVLDQGVFSSGKEYEAGDGVSFGGSFWIAQEKTSGRPETGKGWRLAVKRGRDGKDGANGERGERGLPGQAGRDLTQMGAGGEKW